MIMRGVMSINNKGVMFYVFVLIGILGFVIMKLDGICGLIIINI